MNVVDAKRVIIPTIFITIMVLFLVSMFIFIIQKEHHDEAAMEQKYCAPNKLVYQFSLENDKKNHVVCQQSDGTLILTGDK